MDWSVTTGACACVGVLKIAIPSTGTVITSTRARSLAPLGMTFLKFIQAPRPIVLQQARHRAVRKQSSTGLTPRTIVGLVVGIPDPLHRCAADRAWLPESS